jgi:hypothetical protein
MEKAMIWNLIARVVSRNPIADWLIRQAQNTPYVHIDGYMNRWWLFNGYRRGLDGQMHKPFEWLPSVRVHHILRKDFDRVPHDHPWDARTIILKGWYKEVRLFKFPTFTGLQKGADGSLASSFRIREEGLLYSRKVGDTATLKFNEYHTVTEVSPGGVWTLFFTWKYQGGWGFWVDGKKVPYREYLEKKL